MIIAKKISKFLLLGFLIVLPILAAKKNMDKNQDASLVSLYPRVRSFKSSFVAVTFFESADDVMKGTIYFKKSFRDNFYIRTEITQGKNNKIMDGLLIYDGRYNWTYWPKYKVVIKMDSLALRKNFFQTFGIFPDFVTNENVNYKGKKYYRGEIVRQYVTQPLDDLKKIEPEIGTKQEFLVGDKDGIIRAAYFYDKTDQLSFQIEIFVETKDIELEDSLFRFEPPEDATVWSIPDEKKETLNWAYIVGVFIVIASLLLVIFYRYFTSKRKPLDKDRFS